LGQVYYILLNNFKNLSILLFNHSKRNSRSMASGGNLGSKLAQLSGQHNLCHSFQAFNTCYADTGLWGVYFVTDKLKIDDFMIALQNEWLFKIFFYFNKRNGIN